MTEHARDVVHTFEVKREDWTGTPEYLRLQLRRDGSVTWTPIPLDELSLLAKTYDTKTDSVQRGGSR